MPKSLEKQLLDLSKKLKKISTVDAARANSSAINKSAGIIRTRVSRGVSKQTKIQQKHIRRKLYIKRSTAKSQKASFTAYRQDIAVVSLLNSKTLLSKSRRGTNRRGVKAAGRQFDGAFINVVSSSGQFQVMRRKGSARYPLEVVKIPIKKMVDSVTKSVSDRVMRNDYPRLLKHELAFRLSKYEK